MDVVFLSDLSSGLFKIRAVSALIYEVRRLFLKTIPRFFILPAVVFSMVILLNSCVYSSSNDGTPGAQLLTDENKKKIETVVDKYVDEVKSPAALVGVYTPGGEQVVVRGKSDVKAGTAALATDRFRIASLSKTFTATMLLMLVEDKKIGLEDKLSKFYPNVKNADKITIRQVINHTSGIYSYTGIKEFHDLAITDPLKKWTYDDLLALVAAHDPYCEPGQGFNYSNTNYQTV
jgi:D-alanyl-D-alanine carboxypeptidase